MTADLCPFCGGESQPIRTKDTTGWWYCECTKCYARQLASDTQVAAIAAWNTRSQTEIRN